MKAPEGVKFCPGCPLVPEGVMAQVDTVTYIDRSTFKLLSLASIATGQDEKFKGPYIALESVAIQSANPYIEVGDVAMLQIESNGRDENETIEAIKQCPGPKRGKLAKILGTKGTCQAVCVR